MWVELNETDLLLADSVVERRRAYNVPRNINQFKRTKGSYSFVEKNGGRGEVAFCQLIDRYPDTKVGNFADGDCFLFNGVTIDVKTTHHEHGKLLVTGNKIEHPADLYVLMIGSDTTYRFAGVIEGTTLLTKERFANRKKFGWSYAMEQHELKEFDGCVKHGFKIPKQAPLLKKPNTKDRAADMPLSTGISKVSYLPSMAR